MESTDDQVQRVLNAWDDSTDEANYAGVFLSMETQQVLARQAVEALQCGEPHPDRDTVRCTQLPHGNGHLYHRNTGLGIEWWASGDRTNTIHDVLGPISLVQHPVRADVEVRVPFIGGTPAEPRQEQQRGRYHTLPPCEDDDPPAEPAAPAPGSRCGAKHPRWEWRCHRDPHDVNPDDHATWHHDYDRDRYWGHTHTEEADHGPWGVGDTIPDHVDHVENAHKFEWSRARNRDGENTGWFELTASPVLTEADLLVLCGPVTESTDPPELADALSATIDADRAVYRDLVPVLGPVATFLDQMGKRYREGNPRTTSDQCRAAETFRDQLTTVVDTLQEMTGTGTDDQA
jgi:hypothetical protein